MLRDERGQAPDTHSCSRSRASSRRGFVAELSGAMDGGSMVAGRAGGAGELSTRRK